MCEHKFKSISQEGRASIEETFRAMRYERQRVIAKAFTSAVVREWAKFEKVLFLAIGALAESRGESIASLATIAREQRKILHRENVDAIVMLANYLSAEEIAALESLFAAAGVDMRAIFAKWLRRTYQDGLDMAYDWMKNGHPSDRRSRAAIQNPELFAEVDALYPVSEESLLYRSFYDDALQTISSKVSIFFKGEAFATIADGIANGISWTDIAKGIRQDVGTGALWHWRRLVRTELANAYDRAMQERYEDAGIQYVQRSVARSACPICVGQKGIYELGTQPRVTADSHPNCRCTYIPYYSLPAGGEIRVFNK